MMGMKKSVRAVKKASLLQAAILLMGFGGVIYANEVYNLQNEKEELRAEMRDVADSMRGNIESEINKVVLLARALGLAIEIEPETFDQQRLSTIANKLTDSDTSVINIGVAPDLVVKYVYPMEENASVIGLDYRQNAAQYAAARQAFMSNEPVLAGPLDLVQGGEGFILRSSIETSEAADPSASNWGIISVVLDKATFVGAIHGNHATTIAPHVMAIRRVSDRAGTDTAYDAITGDQAIFDGNAVIMDVPVPSGQWQIAVQPPLGWPVVSQKFLHNIVYFGVAFAAIIALFVLIATLRSKRKLAEVRMRNALEACDQGFALYDPQDRLTLCNSRYMSDNNLSAEMVARKPTFEELIRLAIAENRFSDDTVKDEAWIEERLKLRRKPSAVQHARYPGGRWLKVFTKRMDDGCLIVFTMDVTEIIKAKEAAEVSEIAKTRFMDAVSHELKTPLSILLGYNAFLENPKHLKSVAALEAQACSLELEQINAVTAEVSSHAQRISAAGGHLHTLIDKLLEFTQKTKDEFSGQGKDFRAGQIVGPIAERFRSEASGKGLEFSVIVEETNIHADPVYVDRSLSRMIENAIQTTEKGAIKVSVHPEGDNVLIKVRDTGSQVLTSLEGQPLSHTDFQSDLLNFIKADDPQSELPSPESMGACITVEIDRSVGKLVTLILPRVALQNGVTMEERKVA
ncbi:PAS-domain containing protein [Neptunicoccus sediminis]|uniref:PAS-domain containing protein n=1 Tax=Neptunicoccus sediminis TaxID=1892596 RepID=UPI000845E7F9|nr:PAS-domain containing protein [Neptunicoccus sediminis]